MQFELLNCQNILHLICKIFEYIFLNIYIYILYFESDFTEVWSLGSNLQSLDIGYKQHTRQSQMFSGPQIFRSQ